MNIECIRKNFSRDYKIWGYLKLTEEQDGDLRFWLGKAFLTLVFLRY